MDELTHFLEEQITIKGIMTMRTSLSFQKNFSSEPSKPYPRKTNEPLNLG